MDWSGNLRPSPFVFRQDNPLSFLYNYNHEHFPVLAQPTQGMIGGGVGAGERMIGERMMIQAAAAAADKKKRLSTEQLEALENSFQEEKQLGPERKMKLARELQMPPRQVAIWFQNRRARWKAKQLEQLYDELKMEYDTVCRDRERLQEEVSTLKSMFKDQNIKNQVSKVQTEVTNTEETVESTSDGDRSSGKAGPSHRQIIDHHNTPSNNYHVFNLDDYNPSIISPYWSNVLPNPYP